MSQQTSQIEIIKTILDYGITQESLGAFLGVTRQSIAKNY